MFDRTGRPYVLPVAEYNLWIYSYVCIPRETQRWNLCLHPHLNLIVFISMVLQRQISFTWDRFFLGWSAW